MAAVDVVHRETQAMATPEVTVPRTIYRLNIQFTHDALLVLLPGSHGVSGTAEGRRRRRRRRRKVYSRLTQ